MCEAAWAAGFFDGEGSTSVLGTKIVGFRISVFQTDRTVLERFQEAVGRRGYIYGPLRRPNRRIGWQWSAARRDEIKAVIDVLWPYLSMPKRQQAERVRSIIDQRISAREARRLTAPCHRGHPVSRTIFDKRGNRRCLECANMSRNRKKVKLEVVSV